MTLSHNSTSQPGNGHLWTVGEWREVVEEHFLFWRPFQLEHVRKRKWPLPEKEVVTSTKGSGLVYDPSPHGDTRQEKWTLAARTLHAPPVSHQL